MTEEFKTIVAEEKSTHRADTFILTAEMFIKHPNADTLSVAKIPGTTYTYVAKTDDWTPHFGKLVAHIQPDSVVDLKRPEFSFLKEERVKGRKIRGVNSFGVLVLVPENSGLKSGEDAAPFLDVKHYDPEARQAASKNGKSFSITSGEVAAPPSGIFPKFDVDNFHKYAFIVFKDKETVYVTEKLHGSNGRFTFKNGQMYCGSRNEWKKEFTTPPEITLEELTEKMLANKRPEDLTPELREGIISKAKEAYEKAVTNFKPKKSRWWTILDNIPEIRAFCETHPGWCLYGEVIGDVKNFKYGITGDKLMFRAFDILVPNPIPHWMNADEFFGICKQANIPTVPLLAIMPYDFEKLIEMSEGNTTMPGASHIKEGTVVKPEKDRFDASLGRVCLKIVSPTFLEKN